MRHPEEAASQLYRSCFATCLLFIRFLQHSLLPGTVPEQTGDLEGSQAVEGESREEESSCQSRENSWPMLVNSAWLLYLGEKKICNFSPLSNFNI
jgi:hypothetical protein